jgi:hypothetical protein
MKYPWLWSLLLTAGCHANGAPSAPQEGVMAYQHQHVAGYQPLHWGLVRPWRQVDADSLAIVRFRAREDSLRRSWDRLGKQYADSTISLNLQAIKLNKIASRYDTTRLGTQLGHTYLRYTASGQLVRDSAQFLVPRHGPVVRLPQLKPLY